MAELLILTHSDGDKAPHGEAVTVEAGTATHEAFLAIGYAPQQAKPIKHLSQMNTAELDTYAAELGIDFPKEATINKEKVAFIKTHLEANN